MLVNKFIFSVILLAFRMMILYIYCYIEILTVVWNSSKTLSRIITWKVYIIPIATFNHENGQNILSRSKLTEKNPLCQVPCWPEWKVFFDQLTTEECKIWQAKIRMNKSQTDLLVNMLTRFYLYFPKQTCIASIGGNCNNYRSANKRTNKYSN